MSKLAKALTAAAGNAGGESVYVEDVFSTYVYQGSNAARTIDNGIALSDEGGLVWLKQRGAVDSHILFDTVNGPQKSLSSNSTAAGADYSSYFSFPSAGTEGWNLSGAVANGTGTTWASWTFRKQAGFFDVVTYTGDGSTSSKTISHSLGSTPGHIILKKTSASQDWYNMAKDGSNYKAMSLNDNGASFGTTAQSNVADSTTFDVGYLQGWGGFGNDSGATYVAYLFAHDDQSFGDNSDEAIIKCGSYTGNGNTDGPTVTLGFEPQWIMIKGTGGGDWTIFDNMRGLAVGGNDARLWANLSSAENNGYPYIDLQPTGFKLQGSTGGAANANGSNYIYIAIRRPMKTPESGTEVFKPVARTGTGAEADVSAGFAADLSWSSERGTVYSGARLFFDKLRGAKNRLDASQTSSEVSGGTSADMLTAFTNDGVTLGSDSNWYINKSGNPYVHWLFKRATGFFDVVAYTGTGNAFDLNHNLGVAPELAIIKERNAVEFWIVGSKSFSGASDGLYLNSNAAKQAIGSAWTGGFPTAATSSSLAISISGAINTSTNTYIAYLFATLAGISKVGSYTGTGSNVDVNCGFSAGARFILIKRTDSSGDWYVWDSARGIVAGNDPYLLLNSTAAEVTSTDYIDPLSSGFTVTSSAPAGLNASGGTYIFLAIAQVTYGIQSTFKR